MPEWERSEGVSVQRLLFPQYHIIRGILEKIPPKMSGSAHSKYFYYSWLETASNTFFNNLPISTDLAA